MVRILIGVGIWGQADQLLRTGVEFARATGSSLTVLHVTKDAARCAEVREFADRTTALVQRTLHSPESITTCIRIGAKVQPGDPAEEIVNEARAGDYDLVVIGARPAHHLWHRLLAPATERVLLRTPCPVLIAKGKLGAIRHILLCVSGADNRSKTARFLARIANQMTSDVTITVLHVMSQISAGRNGPQGWQLEASAEQLMAAATPEGQWLSQEVASLRETRARIQPKVRHGTVVDEVLAEMLDGGYDMLVIGAHRQAGWQRFLLDDLSHQIITRADRPILVV